MCEKLTPLITILATQLALFKPPFVMNQGPIGMFQQAGPGFETVYTQPQPTPAPQATPELPSLQLKLEQINEKLEAIRSTVNGKWIFLKKGIFRLNESVPK